MSTMTTRHVRTDPDCTYRWLWTINQRPWYIPRWYERRTRGKACPICRPRELARWAEILNVPHDYADDDEINSFIQKHHHAQRDAAAELTRMRAEEGL